MSISTRIQVWTDPSDLSAAHQPLVQSTPIKETRASPGSAEYSPPSTTRSLASTCNLLHTPTTPHTPVSPASTTPARDQRRAVRPPSISFKTPENQQTNFSIHQMRSSGVTSSRFDVEPIEMISLDNAVDIRCGSPARSPALLSMDSGHDVSFEFQPV